VARFIGGSNVVKGRAGDDGRLECAGARLRCGNRKLAARSEVAISIRPHAIRLWVKEPAGKENIVPATVVRAVMNVNPASGIIDYLNIPKYGPGTRGPADKNKPADADLSEQIQAMRLEMFAAAESLEFEKAARLRDELKKLEALAGGAAPASTDAYEPYGNAKRASGRAPKNTARTKKSGMTLAGAKSSTRGKSRKMKP